MWNNQVVNTKFTRPVPKFRSLMECVRMDGRTDVVVHLRKQVDGGGFFEGVDTLAREGPTLSGRTPDGARSERVSHNHANALDGRTNVSLDIKCSLCSRSLARVVRRRRLRRRRRRLRRRRRRRRLLQLVTARGAAGTDDDDDSGDGVGVETRNSGRRSRKMVRKWKSERAHRVTYYVKVCEVSLQKYKVAEIR